MKLILASLAWLIIAAILGSGIYLMHVKGNPWLFIVAVLGFIFAVGKIGCAQH